MAANTAAFAIIGAGASVGPDIHVQRSAEVVAVV